MLPFLRIAAGRFVRPWTDGPSAELPRGHLPALDALRGAAIVLVTLYRFGGGSEGPASVVASDGLLELGARGVDLFFVLSGFLITGILFDSKGRAHYFRNFYARRALRIFPLYYLTLAALLLVLPRLAPLLAGPFQPAIERQSWLWLYSANVVQGTEGRWLLGPLNHFWSLAIEEHFYLLWPAVIFCLSRRAAMRLCLVLAVACVAGRAAWLAGGYSNVAAEVLTPLRMEGLLLGSWLALAAREPRMFGVLQKFALPALLLCGGLAIAADLSEKRWLRLPDAVWSVAFAALLILLISAKRSSWLGRFGQLRMLRFFGQYSYAMYVFQLPLIYLVAPVVSAAGLSVALGGVWLGQAVYCALLFSLTTLAAVVSWHCFERHVLKLKHRFEAKPLVRLAA